MNYLLNSICSLSKDSIQQGPLVSTFFNNYTVKYPKLNVCHQHAFLIWMPNLIYWIIWPIWIYSLHGKKFFQLKVSILLILKNVYKTNF